MRADRKQKLEVLREVEVQRGRPRTDGRSVVGSSPVVPPRGRVAVDLREFTRRAWRTHFLVGVACHVSPHSRGWWCGTRVLAALPVSVERRSEKVDGMREVRDWPHAPWHFVILAYSFRRILSLLICIQSSHSAWVLLEHFIYFCVFGAVAGNSVMQQMLSEWIQIHFSWNSGKSSCTNRGIKLATWQDKFAKFSCNMTCP